MPSSPSRCSCRGCLLACRSAEYRVDLKTLTVLQLTAEHAAPTGDLTKSFGWDRHDVFLQHDVQVRRLTTTFRV